MLGELVLLSVLTLSPQHPDQRLKSMTMAELKDEKIRVMEEEIKDLRARLVQSEAHYRQEVENSEVMAADYQATIKRMRNASSRSRIMCWTKVGAAAVGGYLVGDD